MAKGTEIAPKGEMKDARKVADCASKPESDKQTTAVQPNWNKPPCADKEHD